MNKLSLGEKCPYCKKVKKIRIHRLFWMRLLLFTKYYFCDCCGARYISMFRLVSLRRNWSKGRNQNIGLCLNLPFQFSWLLQHIANAPQLLIPAYHYFWNHKKTVIRISYLQFWQGCDYQDMSGFEDVDFL